MDFIHSREFLNEGDVVEVNCSHQCNIMLTDDSQFQNYRRRRQFRYFGGQYQYFPARLIAPRSGYWNITIDLGGGSANIKYSINVIRG